MVPLVFVVGGSHERVTAPAELELEGRAELSAELEACWLLPSWPLPSQPERAQMTRTQQHAHRFKPCQLVFMRGRQSKTCAVAVIFCIYSHL